MVKGFVVKIQKGFGKGQPASVFRNPLGFNPFAFFSKFNNLLGKRLSWIFGF
jgi:hypothetical protein